MNDLLWYKGLEITLRLSLLILFSAIAYDFFKFGAQNQVVSEKKSIVETGSMTAFFILYYGVTRYIQWQFSVSDQAAIILATIGTLMVLLGAILNVYGRMSLSHNWANHIKIYDNHELVRSGLYKYVRHPLYATIIFMFIGGSLVFRNILAFGLVLMIFIPFMAFRAKQEERLLEGTFKAYGDYKAQTGMFVPKIGKRRRLRDSN